MSNFRIIRVCVYNAKRCEEFYLENDLHRLAISDQITRYQKENYIMPGSWADAMANLGNECIDLLINAESLQRAWCQERGIEIDFSNDNWMYHVLLEHIKYYKPQVLFFYAGVFTWFSRDERRALRQACPDLKLITGLWGDALTQYANYKSAFSDVDFIFSNTEKTRDELRQAGVASEVLGNCFDNVIASQKSIPNQTISRDGYNIVFLGSTGYGCDLHRERYLKVLSMMRQTDMQVWADEMPLKKVKKESRQGNGVKNIAKRSLLQLLSAIPTSQLRALKNNRYTSWKVCKYLDEVIAVRQGVPIRGSFFPGKEGITSLFPDRSHASLTSWFDFLEVMRKSNYVFNAHRDEMSDYANIRVFEATGVGSCLVSDRGSEMKNFLEPDSEFVAFTSVDEAVEKIEYLSDHDQERRAIAKAGQKRTLREHTVERRCEKIHDIVTSLI